METLPGLDIDRYNILLLGTIGAGKSSFINTVSTVFTGDVVPIAPARQAEDSVTSNVCKAEVFFILYTRVLCSVSQSYSIMTVP